MVIMRKYGVQADVYFPLITRDAVGFFTGATFAAGDVKISKDGAAPTNTVNLPSEVGAGWYKLTLTAAELTAAKVMLSIIDQTDPKAFEDQGLYVETYGNASAEHAFDLDSASVVVGDKTGFSLVTSEHTNIADALLKRDWTQVTGEANRSMLNALRFLRNRWRSAAGTLTVYKEDDATAAWTGVLTTTAGDPVSEVDPT